MSTTLKFSPGNHQYWLDQKRIPGVTTLIKKGLPKPALMYWSSRTVAEYVADNPDTVADLAAAGRTAMIAALKDVPWQRRDAAGIRGTEVHELAHRLTLGERVDVPQYLQGHVESCLAFLDDYEIEPVFVEAPIANRAWWYAGTPDLVGQRPDGQTVLVDWKTADSGVYGETALQLVAYARAEFYIDALGDEAPMPHIDETWAVHITASGYEVYRARFDDVAWETFLHVAHVGRAAKDIESWVEPLDVPNPSLELQAVNP